MTPLLGWLITLAYPKTENTRSQTSRYNQLLVQGKNAFFKGNYEAAIKIYNDAILEFNTEPDAYFSLGAVYAKQGNVDMAIKNVAKAKQLGKKSLASINKEYFDPIRSKEEWIDFVNNDYQIPNSETTTNLSKADELLKLGELLEKGLITQEEFNNEKSKLFN